MKKKMEIQVEIKKAYKVAERKYIVEVNKWDDKIKLLREKNKLKGSAIYLDPKLTFKERTVQKKIRDIAREERKKGAFTRVKFQGLQVNDTLFTWNHTNSSLEETQGSTRGPKN